MGIEYRIWWNIEEYAVRSLITPEDIWKFGQVPAYDLYSMEGYDEDNRGDMRRKFMGNTELLKIEKHRATKIYKWRSGVYRKEFDCLNEKRTEEFVRNDEGDWATESIRHP